MNNCSYCHQDMTDCGYMSLTVKWPAKEPDRVICVHCLIVAFDSVLGEKPIATEHSEPEGGGEGEPIIPLKISPEEGEKIMTKVHEFNARKEKP